jgi:hypothetical protein
MSTKLDTIRHAILAARDFRKRPVSVPEWGFDEGLFVRSLNILDAVAFEKANDQVEKAKTVALYLAFTLCDEDGERIFDPVADLDDLCKKDPEVLSRLFAEALGQNQGDAKPDRDREGKSSPSR